MRDDQTMSHSRDSRDRRWLLLVEDDDRLASLVREYLESNGFTVRIEPRGDRAARRIVDENPDLVVLDIMLPGMDGLEVCRRVRPTYRGPILILTARGDETDEIVGIEVGADDYLSKPVRPRLLLARVSALLRRGPWAQPDAGNGQVEREAGRADSATNDPNVTNGAGETSGTSPISLGRLEIRPASRTASLDDRLLDLTTAEFDLLLFLAARAGTVVTREEIYRELRGVPYDGLDRSMDVRVTRLRRKLGDDAKQPHIIKTVRGAGYLLVAVP